MAAKRRMLRAVDAMTPAPLVVVSHRLPIVNDPDHGWRRSPGGLVSALSPLALERPITWFGHWTGPGRFNAGNAHLDPTIAKRIEPISITESEHRNAIEGFSNRTLWPALHGLLDNIEQLPDWWIGYQRRSDRTAALLGQRVPAGATVWLHDYHHFGVPLALRQLRPDVRIGLFCHTTVDHHGLMSIASSNDLAKRMEACDLIGTQTESDAAGLTTFLDSCGSGRRSAVSVAPVGFDVKAWLAYRDDPVVAMLGERSLPTSGALLVGVDRIDYTKGLTHRLLALEMVLDTGRLVADDVRLVQVAVPSRATIPIYQFLADQVGEIVDRINQRFQRQDGQPVVDLIVEQLPPREIAALMRVADAALITPLRDGMNLVALEFSVLNGDRPVDVILGQGAGAVDTIGPWCDVVDGGDVLALASTIVEVVRRSPEQRAARSRERAAAASKRSSDSWASEFLEQLDHVALANR